VIDGTAFQLDGGSSPKGPGGAAGPGGSAFVSESAVCLNPPAPPAAASIARWLRAVAALASTL
jgi:hypothetical protein